MLTNNDIKRIRSLAHKKFRKQLGLFIAEGEKVVEEIVEDGIFKPREIYHTEELDFLKQLKSSQLVSSKELERISQLKTPNKILGVFEISEQNICLSNLKGKFTLLLDGINDPGNLGTIIRIANWFGIDTIICSENTVDVYNPKVVQATMGSISRVKVFYQELKNIIPELQKLDLKIFGAVMDGENIYKSTLPNSGVLVIGSESHGISEEILELIDNKISIPSFDSSGKVDSLNASIATAIICSEFKKQNSKS